jgi:hypothetical protein
MSKLLPSSGVIIFPAFVWVNGRKNYTSPVKDISTVDGILTEDIRINQR